MIRTWEQLQSWDNTYLSWDNKPNPHENHIIILPWVSKRDHLLRFKFWSFPMVSTGVMVLPQELDDFIWLVVWLPSILFSHRLGMSSSQLTNSYFSEG